MNSDFTISEKIYGILLCGSIGIAGVWIAFGIWNDNPVFSVFVCLIGLIFLFFCFGFFILPFFERNKKEDKSNDRRTMMRDVWIEQSIFEIESQCKYAQISYKNLKKKLEKNIDISFSSAHSFLIHAANISKLLLAIDIADASKGMVIGKILNIDIRSCIHDRCLRNNLEHYDERLKNWIKDLEIGSNIGINNIGPKSAIDSKNFVYVKHLDPGKMVFTFIDEDFDLESIMDEITHILLEIKKWKLSNKQ